MLDIQIVSDLHIEYLEDEYIDMFDFITPKSKYLVLAGDIGSLYREQQLFNFLKQCCDNFEKVFYIPGNHEFYTLKWTNFNFQIYQLRGILYSFEKKLENLKILDRHHVTIDNYIIAGCTLWSHLGDNQLPKFRVKIAYMNTRLYNIYYKRDLQFIKSLIENKRPDQEIILITHYPPSRTVSKNKHLDKYSFLYYSNLDYLLNREMIHTWVSGHVHCNFDFLSEGGTRLVGNQKGRERDNITDFSKSYVLKFE